MTPKLTRRQLLKLLAFAATGSGLAILNQVLSKMPGNAGREIFLPSANNAQQRPTQTNAPQPTPTNAPQPTPTNAPQPTPSAVSPRVVHVHGANATSWTGSPNAYWNYVNQDVVDTMVDQGVMRLTGTSSVPAAWKVILPNHQSGQKIAIKVSFNNTDQDQGCEHNERGLIDGIIEPVNAIIRGLKTIGVPEDDIHIYETIRNLPPLFVSGCDYPGVKFYDRGGCGNLQSTHNSSDPDAVVKFYPPAGDPAPPTLKLNDVLIKATYLINIPIIKIHGMAGYSLAMKNHYGSTQKPGGLHSWSSLKSPYYQSTYSPIVDLYRNPHIVNKTILTVGDGIFAAWQHTAPPMKWKTFGNEVPKSLFFSFDPVAIDCVMGDLLDKERPQTPPLAGDYLAIAQNVGLGTCERGNPWANPPSSGYKVIDYQKIEV